MSESILLYIGVFNPSSYLNLNLATFLPRFLFSHWFAWTSFQRHTTRWHHTFVRMLHGARCNRAMILLQAALASWQQYTLRTLKNVLQSCGRTWTFHQDIILYPPETNIAPENRPKPNRKLVPFLGANC